MPSGTAHRRSALPISALIHNVDRPVTPLPIVKLPIAIPFSFSLHRAADSSSSPPLLGGLSRTMVAPESHSSCNLPDMGFSISSSISTSLPSPRLPDWFSSAPYATSVNSPSSPAYVDYCLSTRKSCIPPVRQRFKSRRTHQSHHQDRVLKNPWTPAETAHLALLVAEHGAGQWAKIANHIPGRSGKQVRERWKNHLDPSLKKSTWTVAEDAVILRMYEKVGKKWSTIARELPGRSDNNVKNRFYCSLRPKALRSSRNIMFH